MSQNTDTAVVYVDEVKSYLGELSRTGSKAAGMLASMWSGQMVGVTAGGRDSRTRLPAHAYRLVLLMLAQPGLCAPLFSAELVAGGSPQRPVWLPAEDWTPCPVVSSPLTEIEIADWRSLTSQDMFPREAATPENPVWVQPPPKAKAEIQALDAARPRLSPAQMAALTSEEREQRRGVQITRHAVLTRLKVMVALAALHKRTQPTDFDWDLAGVVMRVNLGMLSYLHVEAEKERVIEAQKKGTLRGQEQVAASGVVADAEDIATEKMLGEIVAQLSKHGPLPRTALYEGKGGNRRRKLVPLAIRLGLERDLLVQDECGVWERGDFNMNKLHEQEKNRKLHAVPNAAPVMKFIEPGVPVKFVEPTGPVPNPFEAVGS